MGPIINTIIGAGIKLGVVLLNSWIESKQQNQLLLAARDKQMVDAIINNQQQQASDPFVKMTRRVLFTAITFTLCYLMLYYAMNPGVTYDVVVPKGESHRWGVLSWIVGGKDYDVIKMTGGLLLTSFFDLCFMVIGFYAVPSKRR